MVANGKGGGSARMLLNFKKQFVPFILDGSKTHTIRACRASDPKVGETLHCYTGLRQKGAQLLGRWPCVKVEEIRINVDRGSMSVRVDGVDLDAGERELLAQRDGFKSLAEMMLYWVDALPFSGLVIHWRKSP